VLVQASQALIEQLGPNGDQGVSPRDVGLAEADLAL
jgi:hypothetical protein